MSTVSSARVAAIVLAAGSSRRMGRPKQLLPLAGRPLVQHAIDAAAGAGLDAIVVVLGHEAAAIRAAIALPANACVVVNGNYAAGQSTSLACGLAAAGADVAAVVVLLGDQPDVSTALVQRVVAAFRAGTAPVVRPLWQDANGAAHPGHPVVLARRVWSEVAALSGDHGARALFERHPEWVHELRLDGPAPRDVDDDDDYERVRDAAATHLIGG